MQLRWPWKIRKLPTAVPNALAITFLTSAVMKLFSGGYLCGPDPWAGANYSMIPLEFAVAIMLWQPKWREFGSLLGSSAMAGAAALLTWAHLTGRDVSRCGCFGPIEMPYGAHMAVIVVLFALCALTLSAADDRAA
jgi:hypothetical protein